MMSQIQQHTASFVKVSGTSVLPGGLSIHDPLAGGMLEQFGIFLQAFTIAQILLQNRSLDDKSLPSWLDDFSKWEENLQGFARELSVLTQLSIAHPLAPLALLIATTAIQGVGNCYLALKLGADANFAPCGIIPYLPQPIPQVSSGLDFRGGEALADELARLTQELSGVGEEFSNLPHFEEEPVGPCPTLPSPEALAHAPAEVILTSPRADLSDFRGHLAALVPPPFSGRVLEFIGEANPHQGVEDHLKPPVLDNQFLRQALPRLPGDLSRQRFLAQVHPPDKVLSIKGRYGLAEGPGPPQIGCRWVCQCRPDPQDTPLPPFLTSPMAGLPGISVSPQWAVFDPGGEGGSHMGFPHKPIPGTSGPWIIRMNSGGGAIG